ncbi:MAG: hypothetical protein II876_06940 [Synergistaceae bacterium]|nr:hypothetical protein [Synergistaceae bacterium]
MKKTTELLRELKRWCVEVKVECGRIRLSGGNAQALKYYREMIGSHPRIEAHLILEIARNDEDLMCVVEERAAIRWADGLLGDLFSAVLCNITE